MTLILVNFSFSEMLLLLRQSFPLHLACDGGVTGTTMRLRGIVRITEVAVREGPGDGGFGEEQGLDSVIGQEVREKGEDEDMDVEGVGDEMGGWWSRWWEARRT